MKKTVSKNWFLIFTLLWLLASALFAAGQNTTGHWLLTLPDGESPEISFLTGSEETQYTIPSADYSVPSVHIVPGLDGVFDETLLFSGYMVFTADSEEIILRQEYNDEYNTTAVKITTSVPATLFCHGEGHFIGREVSSNHHLLITEPPFSPSCKNNRIELSRKKHHWLVYSPARSQFKTGKLLADELLQDMSVFRDSFLPEPGIKIIAFPGELGISSSGDGKGTGGGSGGGGGKKNHWASNPKKYDDSSDEEDEFIGKTCPKCKLPPCPDCDNPHCRGWQFKIISVIHEQAEGNDNRALAAFLMTCLLAGSLHLGNGEISDHSK